MRHARALAALAIAAPFAAACADVLGVRDFVYVEDGAVTADAASDAPGDGRDGDTPDAPIDAADAGCVKCANTGGAPCAVACGEDAPRALAIDGKTLAWVTKANALRAATLPSSPAVTVASLPGLPTAAFASAGELVWSDGAIVRAVWLADGGARTLVSDAGAVRAVAGPVTTSPYPTTMYLATAANVLRCPLPDCVAPLLQVTNRNQITGLVSTLKPSPQGPYGFWIDMGDPQRPVVGSELVGGTQIQTSSTQGLATGVLGASDTNNVYYATFSGNASQVWRLGAGAPAYTTPGNMTGIAVVGADAIVLVDDTQTPSAGKVVKVLGGGGVQTVATDQDRPSSLVLDETYVYWSTLGGAVMRAAR